LRSSAFLVNFLRVFGVLVFQSYSEFSWDLRSSALLENLGFFGLSAFWSFSVLVNFLEIFSLRRFWGIFLVFGVLVNLWSFSEFSWDLRSSALLVNFLRVFGVLVNLRSSAFLVNFLRVFDVLVFRRFGEVSWDLRSSAFLVNFLEIFGHRRFCTSSNGEKTTIQIEKIRQKDNINQLVEKKLP
ncbi:9877_t:CDS:2, partial [Dentiscutata heterogama]